MNKIVLVIVAFLMAGHIMAQNKKFQQQRSVTGLMF